MYTAYCVKKIHISSLFNHNVLLDIQFSESRLYDHESIRSYLALISDTSLLPLQYAMCIHKQGHRHSYKGKAALKKDQKNSSSFTYYQTLSKWTGFSITKTHSTRSSITDSLAKPWLASCHQWTILSNSQILLTRQLI